MRIATVIRSLVSGSVLYIAMAACAASDHGPSSALEDGGPTAALDAFVDELGTPVKDANAGPLPPDVATEPCDKPGSVSGSTGRLFAVHSYPGKTIADLSAVRGQARMPAGAYTVGGVVYDTFPVTPIVRAGSVAVYCGGAGALTMDSVTLILPQ